MRTYQLAPTVVAVAVFCILGNLLVLWTLPEQKINSPEEDAWVIYYAMIRSEEIPETVNSEDLKSIVSALDRDAAPVAERFTVLTWKRKKYNYELTVQHVTGPSFIISEDGVGHGG